jgi:hypothetical protein
MNLTKLDSPQNTLWFIFYEFPSNNNSYNTRIIPRYSLDIRKMCQTMFWKSITKHKPQKLVSCQNSYYIANEKIHKTYQTICENNYYCRYIAPKISNSV